MKRIRHPPFVDTKKVGASYSAKVLQATGDQSKEAFDDDDDNRVMHVRISFLQIAKSGY